MDVQDKIREQVTKHRVVLYMKGQPEYPMCGFSATAVEILKRSGVDDFLGKRADGQFSLFEQLQGIDSLFGLRLGQSLLDNAFDFSRLHGSFPLLLSVYDQALHPRQRESGSGMALLHPLDDLTGEHLRCLPVGDAQGLRGGKDGPGYLVAGQAVGVVLLLLIIRWHGFYLPGTRVPC